MNQTKLRDLFPIVRTREEILTKIAEKKKLTELYNSWDEYRQKEFLDMCTGMRGMKILYDSYFKEIFNPEYTPDRLSNLLSIILDRKVGVKQVLPNDSTRISDETSLIVTDIVVELEDKTLANVEVQKIGYMFAGERASCYSSDLLLRQYKRLRDQSKEHFSYKEIKPVYTIVFFESSPAIFKTYPNDYIHRFIARSNTGISLNMLQNYVFIPLDIFLGKLHNEGIKSELDAWLTFLGCDEPEYIIKLVSLYPYFKSLYEDLYKMCSNVERVMNMFSEELAILDRNTVKLMIDELQEQLECKEQELDDISQKLDSKEQELDDVNNKLDSAYQELDKTSQELDKTSQELDKTSQELDKTNQELDKTNQELNNANLQIVQLREKLAKYEKQ